MLCNITLISTIVALICLTICMIDQGNAFIQPMRSQRRSNVLIGGRHIPNRETSNTVMHMAKAKKKRRKRKQEPTGDGDSITNIPDNIIPEDDLLAMKELSGTGNIPSLDDIKAIADFKPQSVPSGQKMSIDNIPSGPSTETIGSDTLVDLPNIRDVLKNKELKMMEEEEKQKSQRKRISRKDTKAFLELLEAEPFADADASYFEEEKYGTVSALLAEGAKPFLGIPPGPLQVGHFIGSLGIILCAFVEYPGFPLTNLPTPLRDALQGGLGVVYLINTILAVLAVFKASERGQSAGLWAVKTLSVGGLALDQLTQLPTLKQVEELESRKGARAIKKKN